MSATARVVLDRKVESARDQITLYFSPDYRDKRNAEWAKFTPALSLMMVVTRAVADTFIVHETYKLTLESSD